MEDNESMVRRSLVFLEYLVDQQVLDVLEHLVIRHHLEVQEVLKQGKQIVMIINFLPSKG